MSEELPFGPLDESALHVCIDMQRIFLEPGSWFTRDGLGLIDPIKALIDHAPERSLFTRFITVEAAEDAKGAWQRYYRHWSDVVQAEAGAEVLDVHSDLLPFASPENVLDKVTYDAFISESFSGRIAREAPSALIFSGVETDICVLATVMSAVDLGYRTIIASDAVASSVPASHKATMEHVYARFDQQIELVSVDTIIRNWNTA